MRGDFINIVAVDIPDNHAGKLPRRFKVVAFRMLRQHANRHGARLYNCRIKSENGILSLEFDMYRKKA